MVWLLVWLVAFSAQAVETKLRRTALVIGNNAYQGALLLNPVNDARAMASTLEASGFSVLLLTDANQSEMLAAVREFGDRLKDSGGVGVFYFAGHGMQIKGRNFLIPVGSRIEREDEVAYQAIEAQAVLDKMESAGNGTNFMILDACRDNPFMRSFRSAQAGLAAMEAPVGTLVAFATAPGLKAADGSGSNGLYTSHLLSAIRQPGVKVEDVFKQVRSAVRRESQGRQVPMEWSSLEGDFFFVPAKPLALEVPAEQPAAVPSSPAGAVQASIDDALWDAVKDSASSAEVFAYLKRFPSGAHSAEARRRLLELSASTAAVVSAVPILTQSSPIAASEDALWASIQASSVAADVQHYLAIYPNGKFVQAARNRLLLLQRPSRFDDASTSNGVVAAIASTRPDPPPAVLRETVRSQFAGEWVGEMIGPSNGAGRRWPHRWNLEESDGLVTGVVTVHDYMGPGTISYRIRALVQGTALAFKDIELINNGGDMCLPSVEVEFTTVDGVDRLVGTYGARSGYRGCPANSAGIVELTRVSQARP
jgi:uncharacterized caspase-like protein